jgi:hypothetical protein
MAEGTRFTHPTIALPTFTGSIHHILLILTPISSYETLTTNHTTTSNPL